MAREDLRLYPTDDQSGLEIVTNSDGVVQGVTGTVSLASWVIRVLLTNKGTDLLDPNKGSILASMAGGLYNPNSIKAQVLAAIKEVETYIKSKQILGAYSLDELLERLELQELVIGTASLRLKILVQSRRSKALAAVEI